MGGKTRPPYPAEYRQQILELYAAGRSVIELSKEFGCSSQTIHNWIGRAGPLSKLPDGGTKVIRTHVQAREVAQATALNAQERADYERLRKEVRRLQTERDILAKATAWFAVKGEKTSTGSMNS